MKSYLIIYRIHYRTIWIRPSWNANSYLHLVHSTEHTWRIYICVWIRMYWYIQINVHNGGVVEALGNEERKCQANKIQIHPSIDTKHMHPILYITIYYWLSVHLPSFHSALLYHALRIRPIFLATQNDKLSKKFNFQFLSILHSSKQMLPKTYLTLN